MKALSLLQKYYSQDNVTLNTKTHKYFQDYIENIYFDSIGKIFIPEEVPHQIKGHNGHKIFYTTIYLDTRLGPKEMTV